MSKPLSTLKLAIVSSVLSWALRLASESVSYAFIVDEFCNNFEE